MYNNRFIRRTDSMECNHSPLRSPSPDPRSNARHRHPAFASTDSNSSGSSPKSRHESRDTQTLGHPIATIPQIQPSPSSNTVYNAAESSSQNRQPTIPPPTTPSSNLPPSPPFPNFRPGITAEGYVLQPYRCSPHVLADAFDFRERDILSVPFRTSSMHPNTITRFQLRPIDTPQGRMYVGNRLVVVIKLYNETMRCLPMFTFDLAGISAVPRSFAETMLVSDKMELEKERSRLRVLEALDASDSSALARKRCTLRPLSTCSEQYTCVTVMTLLRSVMCRKRVSRSS